LIWKVRASPGVIGAAGILMGIILLFFSVTGIASLLSRFFTKPISLLNLNTPAEYEAVKEKNHA